MVLAAAHFYFWGVQDISDTPRILSPLGKSHGMVFNLARWYNGFSRLSCFSPYFSHIPFISLQRTLFWEAFGFDRFSIFSSFWASCMVLAAAHFYFWGVQDISDTPRIISPLGKSHGMVFNLARWYNGFSRLSCFSPYFSHIPFISLQRTLFWEAFGFDRFFNFSSFWASWMVLAAAHFYFWGVQDISKTPRIISPFWEIPGNSIQPGSLL